MLHATKLLAAGSDGDVLELRLLGADRQEHAVAIDANALGPAFGLIVAALCRMPAGAPGIAVPSLAAPTQVQLSVVPGRGTPAALLLTCGPASVSVALPRTVMTALRDHLGAYLVQPPSQAS